MATEGDGSAGLWRTMVIVPETIAMPSEPIVAQVAVLVTPTLMVLPLVGLRLLTAGAVVCLAGVSRFAAGRQDQDTGQELATLAAVAGLAAAILGAAWSGGGAAR